MKMTDIGYYRSAPDTDGRARIIEAARRRSMELSLILSDEGERYSAFRSLQNMVKLRVVGTVIMPDSRSLGEDPMLRLENRLFFQRNGVRLIVIQDEKPDARREAALAVKRFYSLISEYDVEYGLKLPPRSVSAQFRRVPPYGYRVVNGAVEIDPEAAGTVRSIFNSYAAGRSIRGILADLDAVSTRGKRFCNMTIKTIVGNERYIGRRSKKGYSLKPIITYDTWLKAKERAFSEYAHGTDAAPIFTHIRSDKPFACFDSSNEHALNNARLIYGRKLLVDAYALEKEIVRLIAAEYDEKGAEAFYHGYVVHEAEKAGNAASEARSEHMKLTAEFNRVLKELRGGCITEELLDTMDRLTDAGYVSAARLRRAESEKELFSIGPDQISEVFSRASRMNELSPEERRFYVSAFIRSIDIRNGRIRVCVISPSDGSVKKQTIRGVLY